MYQIDVVQTDRHHDRRSPDRQSSDKHDRSGPDKDRDRDNEPEEGPREGEHTLGGV